VELRGFEPLTSAVQAPARLTGSSLPFVGDGGAQLELEPALGQPAPVPAPRVAVARKSIGARRSGFGISSIDLVPILHGATSAPSLGTPATLPPKRSR
jgi:hypothetical protein